MKLFEKLEALVDELTGLVKEERARRNAPYYPFGIQWSATNLRPDFYGPNGTEFRVMPDTTAGKP